jgi:hypothetical protein
MTDDTESMDAPVRQSALLYLGVFCISAAALLLEIALTRLYSVILWHHFAFMVVSMALLGYGAGGSLLMGPLRRLQGDRALPWTALGFAVSIPIAFALGTLLPVEPVRLAWDAAQPLWLFGLFLLLAVPFFFAGLSLSLIMREQAERAGRIYMADLAGAAIGCLLPFALFSFGGTVPLTAAGLLGLLGGACFALRSQRRTALALLGGCGLLLIAIPGADVPLSPYKTLTGLLQAPGAELLETRWDASARADIVRSLQVHVAPGLSLQHLEPLPPQLGLTIDGERLTAMTRIEHPGRDLAFTRWLPAAIPYILHPSAKAFVVEPGGGLEILTAWGNGARKITAVFPSPLLPDLLRESYREASGRLLDQPHVTILTGEPRPALRQARDRYGVIHLTLLEAQAVGASVPYGLSEEYRWTMEAFKEYLDHLEADGWLAVTHYLQPPPRIAPRLMSLMIAALEQRGIAHPEKHLAAIRSWGTMTLLLKATPITPREIALLRAFAESRRFDLVVYPGISGAETNRFNRFADPVYERLLAGILRPDQRQHIIDRYPFDLRPPTDDNPFFFHFLRRDRLGEVYDLAEGKWQIFLEGGYLVVILFLLAFLFSLLLILLPLAFSRKDPAPPHPARGVALLYFLAIGLGFMLLEISLLQQGIGFLDRPATAVAVTLFSLLLSAGIGSRFSERIKRIHLLLPAIMGIAILAVSSIWLLPPLLDVFLAAPLAARSAVLAVALLPLGLLLGMPFPTGVRLLAGPRGVVPWAWAVNGCASVLGAVLAVLLAVEIGFSGVRFVSGGCYLIALGSLIALARRPGGRIGRSTGAPR